MEKTIDVYGYHCPGYYSYLIHDFDDEVLTYSIVSDKVDKTPRQVKLYHTSKDTYFRSHGKRIYLSECLRKKCKLTYNTKTKEVIDLW